MLEMSCNENNIQNKEIEDLLDFGGHLGAGMISNWWMHSSQVLLIVISVIWNSM